MLKCFEHWFGRTVYVDGYKLVETPHLGMEHQSAIATAITSSTATRRTCRGRASSAVGFHHRA